jgi:hypothetical protein
MKITEDLIELIGIILGDGGILYDENSHRYMFSVTLNGIDEFIFIYYLPPPWCPLLKNRL